MTGIFLFVCNLKPEYSHWYEYKVNYSKNEEECQLRCVFFGAIQILVIGIFL